MPLALASNYLPHYIASSSRPGSLFIMNLIAGALMLPGALLAGIGAAFLIETRRPRVWVAVLTALITVQFIASYFGWSWGRLERETLMAMAVTALLMMVAVVSGYLLGERRLRRLSNGRPA